MQLGITRDGDENVLRRGKNQQSLGRENGVSIDQLVESGVEPHVDPEVYGEEPDIPAPDATMLRVLYNIATQNPRALCVLLMRSVGRKSVRAIAENLKAHGKNPDLKAVVRAEMWLRKHYPGLAETMK